MWLPKEAPLAILQLSHGMIEHIERYDDFARFLTAKGILVVGNDHLGHGKSVHSDDELGFFNSSHPSQTVVDDLHELTLYMKAQYPGIPYFLLGHSMGSFMARRYLMTYGSELQGAIILGTGQPTNLVLSAGKTVVNILELFKKNTHRSEFANNLCFGMYNKKFKPARTTHDWLTRNNAVVDAYKADKYCSYLFTLNGYQTLFDTFSFIKTPSNIKCIPKSLPIHFAAGTDDPVGDYGKTVIKICTQYRDLGMRNISLKLYENARHELLNELNKNEVYEDLYKWLVMHLSEEELYPIS